MFLLAVYFYEYLVVRHFFLDSRESNLACNAGQVSSAGCSTSPLTTIVGVPWMVSVFRFGPLEVIPVGSPVTDRVTGTLLLMAVPLLSRTVTISCASSVPWRSAC